MPVSRPTDKSNGTSSPTEPLSLEQMLAEIERLTARIQKDCNRRLDLRLRCNALLGQQEPEQDYGG